MICGFAWRTRPEITSIGTFCAWSSDTYRWRRSCTRSFGSPARAIGIVLGRPAYGDGERILPDGSIRHARAALLSLPGAVLTMDADPRDEDHEAADRALIAELEAFEREFDKLGL